MPDLLQGFRTLPPNGLAAVALIALYAIQAELRFGAKARARKARETDRGSSRGIHAAVVIVMAGFVLGLKGRAYGMPDGFVQALLPGMPTVAWVGIAAGAVGLALRFQAVLTLRERYTRTLLTQEEQTIERKGPYRWVRHRGYLGSLLCLNGVVMATGNYISLAASLVATIVAYRYRIRVEDEMLLKEFGEGYAVYRAEVGALIPFIR